MKLSLYLPDIFKVKYTFFYNKEHDRVIHIDYRGKADHYPLTIEVNDV